MVNLGEQLTALFEKGSFFIMLDLPVGFSFGIDFNSWSVGNRFKGLKLIPPGPHVLNLGLTAGHGTFPSSG
jgi:A1 cistron-splicing factor AAR2